MKSGGYMLLKQTTVYLILSLLVVFFAKYVQLGTHYIAQFYANINLLLVPYLSHDATRHILMMVLIPVIIAGIPAIVYRLIKKQNMPYYLICTWALWIILVLSNALS
jgi:hypothetical protein